MRVDGGASVMDVLCQFQADLLGVTVRRAAIQETTALGAAFLAGVAEGVWASPRSVNDRWSADASFAPADGRPRSEHTGARPGDARSSVRATGRATDAE